MFRELATLVSFLCSCRLRIAEWRPPGYSTTLPDTNLRISCCSANQATVASGYSRTLPRAEVFRGFRVTPSARVLDWLCTADKHGSRSKGGRFSNPSFEPGRECK